MEEMEAKSKQTSKPIRMCVATAEGCYSGKLTKLTPKRGEQETAPRQDLGGSTGGAEEAG